MQPLCENAPEILFKSLEILDCADYYDEETIFLHNRSFTSLSQLIDQNMFDNSSHIIQLLHDISIQLRFLNNRLYTFTDVELDDIFYISGHYVIVSSEKLVEFDKTSNWVTLYRPIQLGTHLAPEIPECRRLPMDQACHKKSVLWSLGSLLAHRLTGLSFVRQTAKEASQNEWESELRKLGSSSVGLALRRCLAVKPEERMLIVI